MSTILIIDDHPAFRMIVRLQLMQLFSVEEVVEADNGQTAVEMARQYKPDLAILDLDIPRLKLVHPPIRVMVLSGHDPATFALRAMRSGVHGFVGKSQEMKEIMRGVEAVLAGYTVFPVAPNGASIAPGVTPNGDEGRIMLLSDKELVILQMLSKGMSNKAIGDALFISDKTVSTYKSRIQEKLVLSSLAALIEFAALHKLID
ncbi:MAG: DNA-binding response regulator, LuxR family, near polyamine transporter [uncultured Paraburkholderia sp.]|nr:MAG: DNA-binding response regulator, LuxR family, near polyamine transporter [uncultured Paraburkholderia sp.]